MVKKVKKVLNLVFLVCGGYISVRFVLLCGKVCVSRLFLFFSFFFFLSGKGKGEFFWHLGFFLVFEEELNW